LTEAVLHAVASIGVPGLYLLVAALAFAETAAFVGLAMPGEVALIMAGAAVRGQGSLGLASAAGALGAVAGDSTSFFLGWRFGRPLVCRWRWVRERLEPKVEHAEDFFDRHGGAAVFLGRWVGALRSVVALVAGMSGMAYRRFVPWNVAAAIAWVTVVVSLGYVFGRSIARTVDRYALLISVVAVAGLVAWWVVRRTSERQTGGERRERAGVG